MCKEFAKLRVFSSKIPVIILSFFSISYITFKWPKTLNSLREPSGTHILPFLLLPTSIYSSRDFSYLSPWTNWTIHLKEISPQTAWVDARSIKNSSIKCSYNFFFATHQDQKLREQLPYTDITFPSQINNLLE